MGFKTNNGCKVSGLTPYDWGVNGKNFKTGYINDPTHNWVIWNLEGKARYVKNYYGENLSEFNLVCNPKKK